MRILIFVSNIGSFLQIKELCKRITDRNLNYEFTFLLSGSCLDQEVKGDFEIIRKKIFNNTDIDYEINKKEFNNVYIGISSIFDFGEKYLCRLCKKMDIKSWTIQDYPSSFGTFSNNCIPDISIVFEKKDLINCIYKYPRTKPLIFISPKHLLFEASSTLKNKLDKISSNQILKNQISIALQPLLPNIKNKFFEIIKLLEKEKMFFEICLHPSQFNDKNLKNKLKNFKYLKKINDKLEENIVSLFRSRFIITFFSSVVMDLDKGLGKIYAACEKIYLINNNNNKYVASNVELYLPRNIPYEIFSNFEDCLKDIFIRIKGTQNNNFEEKNKYSELMQLDKQIDSLFQLLI